MKTIEFTIKSVNVTVKIVESKLTYGVMLHDNETGRAIYLDNGPAFSKSENDISNIIEISVNAAIEKGGYQSI